MNNLLRLLIAVVLGASVVMMVAVGLAGRNADLLAPVHLLLFVVALAVYLLPAGLAEYRDCKWAGWIVALDILLGWTILGWVIALGWAVEGKTRMHPLAVAAGPEAAVHGH